MSHHASSDWTKASAPIAQVLNGETSTQHPTELLATSQLPSTSPFSGKLVDILLDTSGNVPNERRRFEEHLEEPSRNLCDVSVITLPQLPQRPAKTAKRPRIPPLLQGLHQPPPLPPTGKRFPPITDGVSELERDICDRLQSCNANTETRSVEVKDSLHAEHDESRNFGKDPSEHRGVERNALSFLPSPGFNPVTKPTKLLSTESTTAQGAAHDRRTRKRKIWTDAETRDLLIGVSRYGIGSWKRILHCTDLTFDGRTAVDLKDRFRVCCPSEGRKSRHHKQKTRVENASTHLPPPASTVMTGDDMRDIGKLSNDPSRAKDRFAEGAGNVHQMSQSELAKLGILETFQKSKRRPRHVFSTLDDENLLKGFKKHGTVWHSIRDDAEYGFSNRHPTDLRDRFRIRYPEAFAAAGCKVKGKTRPTAEKDEHRKERPNMLASRYNSCGVSLEPTKHTQAEQPLLSINHDLAERPAGNNPHVNHLAFAAHSTQPMPTMVGESSSAISTPGDESVNHIILNRNILQWAEAHSSSFPTAPPASYTALQTSNHAFSDMTTNINAAHDGLHINPLATLKLPSMALGSHNLLHEGPPTSTSSKPQDKPLSKPTTTSFSTHGSVAPTMDTNPASVTTLNWSYLPRTASDGSSRTPNLPTIVFPHVPVTSARTTVHNLPKPADLLSGLDLEWVEAQGSEPTQSMV